MTNVAHELGNQLKEKIISSDNISSISYDSLLIMGMGGSGVAGDVLKLFSNSQVSTEITVIKNYSIPKNLIEKKPFCLFISYSGNTEETISGLNEAIANNFNWAVISSGGKLIELAKNHQKEFIQIPSGLQPRAAFGYLSKAVSTFLDFNENTDFALQLNDAGSYLNELLEKAEESEIEQLANKYSKIIMNKTCVIYGGTQVTELVSSRWKTQINENSKSKAFIGSMPEVHHNEILSWQADLDGSMENFIIIFLRSPHEHPQISKRFELTKKLLGDKVEILNIFPKESENKLKILMELVLLGDLLSLSLAYNLEMAPEDIDTIEQLKKLLGG
ncbi:MAG: bifunctional phosphoglucose/phosphomannose isomerase [Candidatus Actinomarina sp.]